MNASLNRDEFGFHLPDMLSYHSTWDDADYEPALPRRRQGLLARLAGAPVRWAKLYTERQRVMSELARMSDRDLADLGLSRHEIPRVFDSEFAAQRAGRF